MGESTHEWTKKQKVSATQIKNAIVVCEDCGRKWTATLVEVPLTILIKDLDEYYKKLSNNLIEEVDPPMVLCVFHPNDREIWDTEVTLSCVAPRQDSPYNWSIKHKNSGPAAASGCQLFPWRVKNVDKKREVSTSEQDMVIVKEEIKDEVEEVIEEMSFDPLGDEKDAKPEVNTITLSDSDQLVKNFQVNSLNSLKRFATASAADIVKIRQDRHEDKTNQSTKWAVKVFNDWYNEKIDSGDYNTVVWQHFSKEQLNEVLAKFYMEVRRQDGRPYSKIAYTGLRAGLQRYLSDDPWCLQYSFISDPAFKDSNNTMTGIFKQLSRQGLDVVQHHGSIEPQDIEKLKTTCVIGTDNPLALQRLVWLNIALHFGRWRREEYRDMTLQTFNVKIDVDGRKFLEQTHMPQGRMYEQPGDKYCPIRAYELYISLINRDIKSLWQRPNKEFLNHSCWYHRQVLGKNTLGNFLKSMCIDAGITTIYTNQSACVTTSVLLTGAGFGESDIIQVTGHKSTTGLKNIIHKATQAKKRKMADTISHALAVRTNDNSPSTSVMPDTYGHPPPLEEDTPVIYLKNCEELS